MIGTIPAFVVIFIIAIMTSSTTGRVLSLTAMGMLGYFLGKK
jgi:hypothetical protein